MKRRLEPSPVPHPVVEPGPTPTGYQRCSACNTDVPCNQWVSHKCGSVARLSNTKFAPLAAAVDAESYLNVVEEDGSSVVGTGDQTPSSSQLQPSSSQLQPSSSQLQPSPSQLQPSSSQLQPSSSQEQLQDQGLRLEAALRSSVQGERLGRHDLAFLKTIIQRGLSAPAISELMRTVRQVRAVTLCVHQLGDPNPIVLTTL
jgi:hypothetical protein